MAASADMELMNGQGWSGLQLVVASIIDATSVTLRTLEGPPN